MGQRQPLAASCNKENAVFVFIFKKGAKAAGNINTGTDWVHNDSHLSFTRPSPRRSLSLDVGLRAPRFVRSFVAEREPTGRPITVIGTRSPFESSSDVGSARGRATLETPSAPSLEGRAFRTVDVCCVIPTLAYHRIRGIAATTASVMPVSSGGSCGGMFTSMFTRSASDIMSGDSCPQVSIA